MAWAAVGRAPLHLANLQERSMRLPLAAVLGVCALSGIVGGCCCHEATEGATTEKYPDFMKISPGAEGIGTVRIRLAALDPGAVTYWRNYSEAYSKEVVAYIGVVEVGRVEFTPGETGILETKLPPGEYWIKLRGYTVALTKTEAGDPKKVRTLDRETSIFVTVRNDHTSTATVDYSCMGYPFFAAL
jgi:hypothetical protein